MATMAATLIAQLGSIWRWARSSEPGERPSCQLPSGSTSKTFSGAASAAVSANSAKKPNPRVENCSSRTPAASAGTPSPNTLSGSGIGRRRSTAHEATSATTTTANAAAGPRKAAATSAAVREPEISSDWSHFADMRFVTTANTASTRTSGSTTSEWSTAKYQATHPTQPSTARPKATGARAGEGTLTPTRSRYALDLPS